MKPIVCLDLDGVLSQYSGWQGIENIGPPIDGAVEFTKQLAEFATILIYTCRCKEYPGKAPTPPDATDSDRRAAPELVRIVSNWLNVHGFYYDDIYIGQGKPFAHAIIDDRAVTCRPQQNGPTDYAAALDQARYLIQETKQGDVLSVVQQTVAREEPLPHP